MITVLQYIAFCNAVYWAYDQKGRLRAAAEQINGTPLERAYTFSSGRCLDPMPMLFGGPATALSVFYAAGTSAPWFVSTTGDHRRLLTNQGLSLLTMSFLRSMQPTRAKRTFRSSVLITAGAFSLSTSFALKPTPRPTFSIM